MQCPRFSRILLVLALGVTPLATACGDDDGADVVSSRA